MGPNILLAPIPRPEGELRGLVGGGIEAQNLPGLEQALVSRPMGKQVLRFWYRSPREAPPGLICCDHVVRPISEDIATSETPKANEVEACYI